MTTTARLRAFWDSVRPRTRRGAVIAVAGILGGAGALSAVLFVGAAMAWNPYVDYSLHRDVDARSWAAIDPSFTSWSLCLDCHEPEASRLSSATHAGIGCQSCHGPLGAHVLAGDSAASDTVAVAVPTDGVCVRCHVQAVGRPAGFRQIVPTDHYQPVCLQCHDPHTGIARRPPVVEHPLDDLPPCVTCHGSDGFKARNQRHPIAATDDVACLLCHAAGRGPDDDEGTR